MLVLFIIVMALSSCESESPIILLVDSDEQYELSSGTNKFFYIDAFGNNGNVIQRITIDSRDNQNGNQSLLDTIVNQEKVKFAYTYCVPQYADTTNVTLFFRAYSTGNYSIEVSCVLTVCGNEVLLTSQDDFVMFSAYANNKDGFNLENTQTIYTKVTPDSCVDIFSAKNVITDSLVLAREWQSKTGVVFSRFNDFNYSEATRRSVETAYKEAIKNSVIQNIQTDDIILLGRADTALAVLHVIAVFDEDGCESDRYIFNIKKIAR